jgi:hypothetical protein
MQATLIATPFHHEGWVYEEKVDGWRILAYKDDVIYELERHIDELAGSPRAAHELRR